MKTLTPYPSPSSLVPRWERGAGGRSPEKDCPSAPIMGNEARLDYLRPSDLRALIAIVAVGFVLVAALAFVAGGIVATRDYAKDYTASCGCAYASGCD